MTAKGYQGLAFSIVMAFGLSACLETPKPFSETHTVTDDHSGHDMTGDNSTTDTTTQVAGHDYAVNRWAAATVVATDTISETSNFMFHEMKFVATTSGSGILIRDIHTQATSSKLSYFNAAEQVRA